MAGQTIIGYLLFFVATHATVHSNSDDRIFLRFGQLADVTVTCFTGNIPECYVTPVREVHMIRNGVYSLPWYFSGFGSIGQQLFFHISICYGFYVAVLADVNDREGSSGAFSDLGMAIDAVQVEFFNMQIMVEWDRLNDSSGFPAQSQYRDDDHDREHNNQGDPF